MLHFSQLCVRGFYTKIIIQVFYSHQLNSIQRYQIFFLVFVPVPMAVQMCIFSNFIEYRLLRYVRGCDRGP